MPLILPVKDKHPQFGSNCFIAPNATIVGDVVAGDDCSFWFNTVVRGDVNFIKLGNKVNDDDTQVYDDALTIAYQSGYYDGKKAAQRPWVGLTDEEIWDAYMKAPLTLDCSTDELYALSRTVEAKLKEKNNAT